jgi:hemin uptake protein HemP
LTIGRACQKQGPSFDQIRGHAMTNRLNGNDRPIAARPPAALPRTISSGEILGDGKFVIIRHHDTNYRLQLTAAGKLLLTK